MSRTGLKLWHGNSSMGAEWRSIARDLFQESEVEDLRGTATACHSLSAPLQSSAIRDVTSFQGVTLSYDRERPWYSLRPAVESFAEVGDLRRTKPFQGPLHSIKTTNRRKEPTGRRHLATTDDRIWSAERGLVAEFCRTGDRRRFDAIHRKTRLMRDLWQSLIKQTRPTRIFTY